MGACTDFRGKRGKKNAWAGDPLIISKSKSFLCFGTRIEQGLLHVLISGLQGKRNEKNAKKKRWKLQPLLGEKTTVLVRKARD